MKFEFLHNEDSSKLILIFAGWSTSPSFYDHIRCKGWDIGVVYDYTDLTFPAGILDSYHTVAVFAWSLGVFAATSVLSFDKIAVAIAVNGTEHPVDDEFGIPLAVYQGTCDSLNERNLIKFRRRMCGDAYNGLSHLFPPFEGEISSLQQQLSTIKASFKEADGSNHKTGIWDRVYISLDDRIFPPQAQIKAWEKQESSPEIVQLKAAHYVDLLPIIKSVIPSSEKVAERFYKALPTYNDEADAQRETAERLVSFSPDINPGKVLEIGAGSGIFTRLFANRFHPVSMDFVDLYPLPRYNVAADENYHVADAEDWIRKEADNNPASYDAIISASALQWFVNPEAFFHNASRLLKPGGVLLCSTFLPGNLAELKATGSAGILYRSRQRLEQMLDKYFSSYNTEHLETVMTFPSPRHTLRHLRHTGVGGGIRSDRTLSQLLADFPTRLTYRPLLISAEKTIKQAYS